MILSCRLRPDYVKVDARRLSGADELRRVVGMARDSGTRAVLTRVESTQQLDYLQSLPNVLVQGFAVGPPTLLPGVPQSQAA